jgi:hypothetical protein
MLEELGITWGKRRKGIPWEDRFQALLDYKERFGHTHVPWQWKENVGLAQWVNTQRKKYKDLKDGKKSNLSEEQISLLNSIGFKWSTGGKGRYAIDSPTNEQPSALFLGKPFTAVGVAGVKEESTDTTSSASISQEVEAAVAVSAATAPTNSSMMATNMQQGFAQAPQVNQTRNEIAGAMTSNVNTNYLGSLFGTNQQHVLGGTGHQAPTQGLQQLLSQQFIQPPSNSPFVGAQVQPPASTNALQQLLNNHQQLLVQPPSYNMIGAPQAHANQNDSLSQAYKQLLGQQMHQPSDNVIGSIQVQVSQNQNGLSVLSNLYQLLLNQQAIQPQSNINLIAGTSQAPQNDSIPASVYQQFLDQMNQSK